MNEKTTPAAVEARQEIRKAAFPLWRVVTSVFLMALTFGGLCVFGPFHYSASTGEFITGFILVILLWGSFLSLLFTLLCWIAARLFN